MPMSLRLNSDLEKKVMQLAKRLNVNKTEIVRRSLRKYLLEFEGTDQHISYSLYCHLEEKIPGSGNGHLSVNHRGEVLKRIKSQKTP